MLNATQYLPDLIRLQESLFKVYNRRIDKVEACKTTIRDFIEKLPSELHSVHCISCAWSAR